AARAPARRRSARHTPHGPRRESTAAAPAGDPDQHHRLSFFKRKTAYEIDRHTTSSTRGNELWIAGLQVGQAPESIEPAQGGCSEWSDEEKEGRLQCWHEKESMSSRKDLLHGLELRDDIPNQRAPVQWDVWVVREIVHDHDRARHPQVERFVLLGEARLRLRGPAADVS